MRDAIRRGLDLRREHGLRGVATEDEIDAIMAAAGLRVWTFPFQGRLRGMIVRRDVYVRRGMGRRERTWTKVHELAHHLLHESVPVATYLREPGRRGVSCGGRMEREADAFAGAVMAGVPAGRAALDMDDWLAASHDGGVPVDRLWEFASLLGANWDRP